jgi:hypothetical protein
MGTNLVTECHNKNFQQKCKGHLDSNITLSTHLECVHSWTWCIHTHIHTWPTSFRRNPLFLVSKNPSSPYDRSATVIWGRWVRSIPQGPDWPSLDSRSCSCKMILLDFLSWRVLAVTSCCLIYCINIDLSVNCVCVCGRIAPGSNKQSVSDKIWILYKHTVIYMQQYCLNVCYKKWSLALQY